MHRYERIEQMEREIEEICDNIPAEHCNISECHSCISAYLVDRGYRKASDVAREIFEEIERVFFKHYDEQVTYSFPTLPYHIREALGFSLNVLFMEIEELKKKYEILTSWEELTHTCQVEIPHTIESIADLAFTESEGEG